MGEYYIVFILLNSRNFGIITILLLLDKYTTNHKLKIVIYTFIQR